MRPARLAVGLIAALAAGAGGLALGRHLALARAEEHLRAQGLSWQARDSGWTSVRWRELQGPGLTVQQVEATLLPRPVVRVSGARVELAELAQGRTSRAGALPSPPTPPVPGLEALEVRLEGLDLAWQGHALAGSLSGTLRPDLDLSGPDASLRRVDGRWQGHLDRALELGPARAQARLAVTEADEGLHVALSSDDLVLSHPMLAPRPLDPLPLRIEGRYQVDSGALHATMRVGEVQARLEGQVQPSPARAELTLRAEGVPFSQVIALFGDQVPEARRATCQGELGLTLEVQLPPLTWKATPAARGLRCEGLLVDLDGLREGRVTWKARDADGQPLVRRAGPGLPGFTSWQEGQRLADVIIASEDIQFPTHGGYDLSGIQEALDEAAAGDERPRGGSTLTQQLAKNLYLDGERTLARKLRELMYAVELEASLDKRHILQLYMNIVELGPELYGFGPAADAWFAKTPAGLTDREAAFLVTLLPSPVSGSRRAEQGRIDKERIGRILDNLRRTGKRSPDEIARAQRQPLVLLKQPAPMDPAADPW